MALDWKPSWCPWMDKWTVVVYVCMYIFFIDWNSIPLWKWMHCGEIQNKRTVCDMISFSYNQEKGKTIISWDLYLSDKEQGWDDHKNHSWGVKIKKGARAWQCFIYQLKLSFNKLFLGNKSKKKKREREREGPWSTDPGSHFAKGFGVCISFPGMS